MKLQGTTLKKLTNETLYVVLCLCVMCVIAGNKITSSSLDSFLKSLEMQSEGGLMRLCLEVCCVYL